MKNIGKQTKVLLLSTYRALEYYKIFSTIHIYAIRIEYSKGSNSFLSNNIFI